MTPIIEKYGKEKRFVNWRLMNVKGRKTKVPFQINGKTASSTDESTWCTYEEVKKASDKVGIILHDRKLICIDIDKVMVDGKIVHEDKEIIADLILNSESYVEVSQSGSGLHIFIEVTEPFILNGNRKNIYEIYDTDRYIALTENCYGEPKEVRVMTPDQVTELLKIIGYPWKKEVKEIPEEKTSKRVSVALTDSKLLEKMFDSKNGDDIRRVWDGQKSLFDGDTSKTDAALCSYLAFWTGKNVKQMERLWMMSPLGAREKTQTRADYRKMTIEAALALSGEVYSVPAEVIERKEMYEGLDLLYTVNREKEKVYILNTENICRVLNKHGEFSSGFRYDEFKTLMEICPVKTGKWRPLIDSDIIKIQTRISVLMPCFSKVGKDMVYDSIISVSFDNVYNSAQEYIKSIKWDGNKRLDRWLTDAYGVSDDKYHKAVGSNWIKGLVSRIMSPGCKFDHVLVLEGPQGCMKSSSLTALGGGLNGWHLETIESTDNKDFFMQFQGKAIIEFAEGETFSRTEVRRMKGIISMLSDKYRVPWGRVSQDFPRHCVFAMSTNETEYLKDDTGNRRWLPITVLKPEADVKWIINNRDQMFAEAYYRVYEKKETIYEFPREETMAQQSQRQMQDPNTDATVDWYFNKMTDIDRKRGITATMVYRDVWCGGFVSKPMAKYQEMIIVNVLKNTLNLTKVRKMVDGINANRWFDYSKGIHAVPEMDPRNTKDTITADEIMNESAWRK